MLAIVPLCLSLPSDVDQFAYEDDMVLSMLQVQAQTHPGHTGVKKKGAKSGSEDGIAVVVPGLGNYDRAELTKRNIAWLKKQDIPFECTIFVYKNESVFPLQAHEFAPCKLVRHRGYWMKHVKAFPVNQTKKKWVLHMLDGIEPDQNVNLNAMIEIMKANGLSVASPTMPGYHVFPIMAPHEEAPPPGRLVKYIELQMDLFSREYFQCMQDLASDLNPMGWGMSEALPILCKGSLGLIDTMHMKKLYWGSYDRYIASQQKMHFYKELKREHPGFEPQSCRDESAGQLMDPNVWWMKDVKKEK